MPSASYEGPEGTKAKFFLEMGEREREDAERRAVEQGKLASCQVADLGVALGHRGLRQAEFGRRHRVGGAGARSQWWPTQGLCSVEEDGGAGELNAGEESLGEFVVTSGDGSEMLEHVGKTLDEIALAVEGEIACARGFSVRFGWDDWGDRSIVEGGNEGVGVESLVGDQSAGRDGFDQRFGTSEIVILAGAEHHLDGIAEGIDERVNFGRQSAAGSADGLRTVFFWAPALCW